MSDKRREAARRSSTTPPASEPSSPGLQALPDSCPPATTDRPCAEAAPGSRQLATAPAATPPPAAPPPPPAAAFATTPAALAGPLLDTLFSDDAQAAAAAAQRLCEVAKGDGALQAALGANPRLTAHLRTLLLGGGAGSGSPAAERLQMYAAYLASVLAGTSAAVDAALLDQRLLPALVSAAGSAAAAASAGACGWGVARGALRAVAKLMAAQPACAAAQLLACGGVQEVAGMLDAEDTGEGGRRWDVGGYLINCERACTTAAWRRNSSSGLCPACQG